MSFFGHRGNNVEDTILVYVAMSQLATRKKAAPKLFFF